MLPVFEKTLSKEGVSPMSILSWFKSVTEGGSTADLVQSQPMHFAAGEERFHGLDMRHAMDAHTAWTGRLEAQINGTAEETLDVGTVACDDCCTLGEWIHGDARHQFGGLPSYDQLRKVHAGFHLKAGEVLNEVRNGRVEDARRLMRDIRHESGNVQLALVRLYSDSRD